MTRLQTRVLLVAALVVLVVGAATATAMLVSDDAPVSGPTTTVTSTPETIEPPTTPSSTTTTVPPVVWPPVPGDGSPRAVVTPTGVVLAVTGTTADGRFTARSPCGNEVAVSGTPLTGAHVVLDAGHGGEETGAIGPGGTTEKAVNLAIAQETQRRLEALGATVVQTRTADYRITLASRGAIASSLSPLMFVSIHHNADPDGPHEGPGSETYFQIASPESKRAAGLVYEELVAAFDDYDIAWVGDTDAGTKYRPNSSGGDYYGILKRTAGIPAVLSEAAFISNPPEEALLADPAFQAVEAQALTDAIVRFVTTDAPGSGFIEPYPRTTPAGPGGGSGGCEDPPLG